MEEPSTTTLVSVKSLKVSLFLYIKYDCNLLYFYPLPLPLALSLLKHTQSVISFHVSTQSFHLTGGDPALALGDRLVIIGCNFTGNKGTIGGAIYVKDASIISITSSTFTKNTGISYGGAVAIYYSEDRIKDATVQSSVSISGNSFSSNNVNNFGAALALGYTQSNFNISKNIFNGNTPSISG